MLQAIVRLKFFILLKVLATCIFCCCIAKTFCVRTTTAWSDNKHAKKYFAKYTLQINLLYCPYVL